MEKEKEIITESGSYEFGNNYKLIFETDRESFYDYLDNCNITCGNDCEIECGSECNITCGNNCIIEFLGNCNITCGNNCEIECGWNCNIKAGEGSKLKSYGNFSKTILKDEEFIWWYVDKKFKLINTFEDKDWQTNNPDKYKELYPFVHNELDSATLF